MCLGSSNGFACDEKLLEDVAECEEPSSSSAAPATTALNLKQGDSVSASDGNIIHSLWELGAAVASSIGGGKKGSLMDIYCFLGLARICV